MEKESIYFKERKVDESRTARVGQTGITRKPLIEGGTYKFVNGHLELVGQPTEIKEPLSIRPGAFYRSRDGRKIQVWAINKNSVDKPVVGMILSEDTWKAWYWNFKGVAKVPYGAPNDIVAEWSET